MGTITTKKEININYQFKTENFRYVKQRSLQKLITKLNEQGK